ncbi:MAG: GNAT family N-acetyltransferase [Verrucomicrobiae bacterium]|nr:GNAT family N-acetyltransferase [Verrucomicrobiae bacterium]
MTHPDLPNLEAIYRMNRGPEVPWLRSNGPADSLREQSEGEAIIVAESDEGIVGFASVWEPENFIHHLYVHRDHQEQGVGRSLVEEVAHRYPGDLKLKCVKANQRAIDFYLKTGWREISVGVGPDGAYALMLRPGTQPLVEENSP